MPLFPNAKNFVLNHSHLTELTVNNSSGQSGIDILLEASIPEAAHDSSTRDPPPRCLPGTRREYIEDIIDWALSAVSDAPLPIYWMKGPAGVGKSAVAQTCAEKLRRLKKLGAAFFFSMNRWSNSDRGSINNRDEHHSFFTSIAYQLSTVYPDYRNVLEAKICHDKSILGKTMESQFWGLIVEPLQELGERGLGTWERVPVLVDGLDECESQEAQCEIIEIVAAAARAGVVPLCWAFFSRPEPHIEATFSTADVAPFCHPVTLPISRDADDDIELYLRAGFEKILRRLNIVMASPWPSDNNIKDLVCAAGGLFIYAKTVLRFVGQPDSLNPDELLRMVITVISSPNACHTLTQPFAQLDAFYMLIMQRIPLKILPIIHRVLSVLCLYPYSSAITIANILGMSKVELEAACSRLSALVHFKRQQESLELDPAIDTRQSFLQLNHKLPVELYNMSWSSLGGSISFYHKSARDFLLDVHRSETYCVQRTKEFFDKREWDLVLQFEKRFCWQDSGVSPQWTLRIDNFSLSTHVPLALVQAPGALDSTSIFSYPYANELVNSFIEVMIYENLNVEGTTALEADCDFRKRLYVSASMNKIIFAGQGASGIRMFRCAGFRKYVQCTRLFWLQPGEFPKFDIVAFKERIERRQQAGTIRPYIPTTPSLSKPHHGVQSGLYLVGHGPKSVFWYWEINHDLEYFRQFHALDLAEGQRIYQEQFRSKC